MSPAPQQHPLDRRISAALMFTGAGLGLFIAVAALATHIATDATARLLNVPVDAEIPVVGLFFSGTAYILGLVWMTGVQPVGSGYYTGRARRLLDGVGVGICAFFSAWVLIFSGLGLRGAGLTVTLTACVMLGTATVCGVHAVRTTTSMVLCWLGGLLAISAQTGLGLALDYQVSLPYAVGSAVMTMLGWGLTWLGAHAHAAGGRWIAPPRNRAMIDVPMMAVPLAVALVAATYHYMTDPGFDRTSVVLALVGVVALTVRESLRAIDVHRYAARLGEQERRLRSLVDSTGDVVMILDRAGSVTWQSPASARLFGLSDQDVVGRCFHDLFHPDDAPTLGLGEASRKQVQHARLRDGFGTWRDVEVGMATEHQSAETPGTVLRIADVSDRTRLRRTLDRAAQVDELTTLPNRRQLYQYLAGRRQPGVIMVICLDGIAGVNDMLGRTGGESVLVEAARRLRTLVEPEAPASAQQLTRLDSDSFAIVTDRGAIQAQLLATRALTALTETYLMPTTAVHVDARVGLAEFDPTGASVPAPEEIVRRAEIALRLAKRAGGLEWYDETAESAVRRHATIASELPVVLGKGGFEVRYQPIVELASGNPVGIETIVAWRHPELGLIEPPELARAAADLGLLADLGDWIVRKACRRLSALLADGHELWISVNLGVELLLTPGCATSIVAALDDNGVPPHLFTVEVAETGLHVGRPNRGRHAENDPTADDRAELLTAALTELRTSGARIAIDNFGTEATTLRHLRLLPIDLLKVDRQLYAPEADGGEQATAIIDVVVRFGQQLGLEVVAQGLEQESHLQIATAAGCHLGQGALFSHAVPAEYLEAYLDQHRANLL